MAVDDVEVRAAVEHVAHGQEEIGRGVTHVARRAKRLRDGRHVMTGNLRIAAGEGRHLVAAPVELSDELEHDALGAAVGAWRDALHGRGDLGDP